MGREFLRTLASRQKILLQEQLRPTPNVFIARVDEPGVVPLFLLHGDHSLGKLLSLHLRVMQDVHEANTHHPLDTCVGYFGKICTKEITKDLAVHKEVSVQNSCIKMQ